MSGELFDDIKAAAHVANGLALPEESRVPAVAAAERGRRVHPSGMVEEYERIEFTDRGQG